MAEYEPATANGDVRGSLHEFKVKIRRYARTCGEVLSDRVKIAVVQKAIEDDDLRRHLLMHAARPSTYPLVRQEIRSTIIARDTLTSPAPMDVNSVYKARAKARGRKRRRTRRKIPQRTLPCRTGNLQLRLGSSPRHHWLDLSTNLSSLG